MSCAVPTHDRVAVITDIHANLPALRGGARADRRARDRARLLRWRPRRLRPASQRGLRPDRRARDPDDPRQLRLRDRARPRRLRLRVCHARTTASWASARSSGRWRTPTRGRRTSCASFRSTCASSVGDHGCTSCTARRARSTSTCSRTSRPGSTSASPPPSAATRSPSATPTSRGCASYGGVLFVNCGSVGKPKDGDPRGAFAVLEPARARRR